MDRRQLTYFTTIVESGSMVRAAQLLHVAQPSLSVAVKRLEQEFGVRLLSRTPKGVEPTEAGAHLLAEGRRLLSGFRSLEAHLTDLAEGRAGRVVLASTPAYNWGHLPDLLRRLTEAAPDVEVNLQDPTPMHLIQSLLDGIADVGIVATHDVGLFGDRFGTELEFKVLRPLPLVCVLPPDMSRVRSVSLADLATRPWVVPEASLDFPGLGDLVERIWRRHRFRPPSIHQVSTAQAALPLVAGGIGVALMPDTVRRIVDRSVRVVGCRDELPGLHAVLAWRRERELTPAVAGFIRLAG